MSSRPRILCFSKLMFRLTIKPKLHLSIREQNFADAKTCYEVATSSRRFFSFEIVGASSRVIVAYSLRKKLERRARGPPLAPPTLTIRRPRRRASRAKRGVRIEGIRTNYRARDDGPGATGIDFPPLHRFIHLFCFLSATPRHLLLLLLLIPPSIVTFYNCDLYLSFL